MHKLVNMYSGPLFKTTWSFNPCFKCPGPYFVVNLCRRKKFTGTSTRGVLLKFIFHVCYHHVTLVTKESTENTCTNIYSYRSTYLNNIYLLTETKGRTGNLWCEVYWTERKEVPTSRKEAIFFPVRPDRSDQ